METNEVVIRNIALLAMGTAAYESAWRASVGSGPPAFTDEMRAATAQQVAARDGLLEAGLDHETVHALEGALVVASARVSGDRPDSSRYGDAYSDSNARVGKFVSGTIRYGGIV